MTADPPGCPDCGAAFRPGSPRCPRCSLPLVGPLAGELWQVDQQLARLGARRRQLLAALRDARPSPGEAPSVAASPRASETRPPSVQNLLLGPGCLPPRGRRGHLRRRCVGPARGGREALVLLVVTTVTVLAVPLARRRGLVATGEALAALAVGLALLDAHGLRRADLFALARPDARLYWAGATLLVALVAAAGSARVGAGAWRYAAVALGQLPTPLLAGWLADAGHPAGAAVLLGAQTLALSAAATRWMPRAGVRGRAGLRALLAAGAVLAWVVAVGFALSAAHPRPAEAVLPGVLALLVLAAVAAAAAELAGPAAPSRHPAAFAAAGAVAAAAYAPVARALDGDGRLVALAGIVLLLLLGTAVVPAAWRPGPVGVALVIAAGTMAAVADPTVLALAGPLSWLTDPWSADAAGGARGLVAVGRTWSGGCPFPSCSAAPRWPRRSPERCSPGPGSPWRPAPRGQHPCWEPRRWKPPRWEPLPRSPCPWGSTSGTRPPSVSTSPSAPRCSSPAPGPGAGAPGCSSRRAARSSSCTPSRGPSPPPRPRSSPSRRPP
ncbi:MAG: hypothetical protein ACM3ZF_07220 [Mycobacterium leprae]